MKDALVNYGKTVDETPQSQPIPGSSQVPNSAGGYAYEVDDWTRLIRFLILGTEGGTYYIGEKKLTEENAEAVIRCLKTDPGRAINTIVNVSIEGRAKDNDYAIFALALACSPQYNKDAIWRSYALDSIQSVCRTGTHLFHFAEYVQNFRGWGRGLREAVAKWYTEKDLDGLGYQVVKYRQRDGWTHRDLLRLAHPDTDDVFRANVFNWIVGKESNWSSLPRIIEGYRMAHDAKSAKVTANLVSEYGLPHEALKTEHKNKPVVVTALLESGMPIGAMIRNLATYTRNGALEVGSSNAQLVLEALGNEEKILKARVHPIQVLSALMIYSGDSIVQNPYSYYSSYGKGQGVENPNPQIIDALNSAFYLSFGNVEKTGKRRLISLDVSSSMYGGEIVGVPGLFPALGATAMAMVSARSGDPYMIKGFSTGYKDLGITASDSLTTAMGKAYGHSFGGTDCALPMKWADKNKKEFDIFEVYTDSETWAGKPHPSQALKTYRKNVNANARLAVIGMVSNGFSIADPDDAGMIDVVGFDTNTPNLLSEFAKGNV